MQLWNTILAKNITAAKMLNLIPALSLISTPAPVLTKSDNGQVRDFEGYQ